MSLSKEERQKHLRLNEKCEYRGGDSIQFRGLLALYLDTEIPSGHSVHCCHACHNPECSNPKHLYWGSPLENAQDRASVETIEKRARKRRFGVNNPNFGKRPWQTNNSNIESWLLAGDIYSYYLQTKNGHIKWGSGPAFIQKTFGVAQGSSKKMIAMFRAGWNPHEDSEWLAFKNIS